MKYVVAILTAMIFTTPALAQHKHGAKGPAGGPMEDVAGVHAELVADGTTVKFNILDEDSKPVATKQYSGSVLIVNGAERETVALSPSGDNALQGQAKKAIPAKAAITLMLKTDAGKSGQARFTR